MLRLFVGSLNSFSSSLFPRHRLGVEKSCERGRRSVSRAHKLLQSDWNVKLTAHEEKSVADYHTSARKHVESARAECCLLDENQYLIMQLSIRKLLSLCLVRSPNGSPMQSGARVRQTRQWIGIPGCCFLIYGPKIIIRSRPQIPSIRRARASESYWFIVLTWELPYHSQSLNFGGNWSSQKEIKPNGEIDGVGSHPHWPASTRAYVDDDRPAHICT